jgi:SNF2 family DNA or RNA helicase
MFPKIIEEPYYIDWDPKDRKIYDRLRKKIDVEGLNDMNILGIIGVMQMLCDAPSMVQVSADNREAFEEFLEALDLDDDPDLKEPIRRGSEAALALLTAMPGEFKDDRHTKLDTTRMLLTEEHPNEKSLIFTTYGDMFLPIMSEKLTEWGISHVVYRGATSQKQNAQDTFKRDSSIQVFLSSDAGSDSIDLEEASVVINYNLPWKWSTLVQRQNRPHRVTSKHDTLRIYTLMMANSIEDRKLQIIMNKLGFHNAVFKGAIAEDAMSSRMTYDDYLWMIS